MKIFIIFIINIISINSIKRVRGTPSFKTDTIGMVIERPYLNKLPYELERCDQVAIFNGTTILDMNDLTSRKEAMFYMSIYLLNMINPNNLEDIVQSIEMRTVNYLPKEIDGANKCLRVIDSENGKELIVCLKDKEYRDCFKKLFYEFKLCRQLANNCTDTTNTTSILNLPPYYLPNPDEGEQAFNNAIERILASKVPGT